MFECSLERTTINWINLYHIFPRQKRHFTHDSPLAVAFPCSNRVPGICRRSRAVLLWKEEIGRAASSALTQNKTEVSEEELRLKDAPQKFQEGHLLGNSPAGREVPLWNWGRSPRRCSFRYVEALCLHLLPQAIRSTSSCSGSPAAGPTSVPLFSFHWLWLCLQTAALNFPAMDPVILQLALGVTTSCLLISLLQV